ncbi:MAG: SDR family NAD(P)-dependent oxidoreductase [Anaeromyxobacteraceae bacterium]
MTVAPLPRTVFITGASSGLGRGLALHYAAGGATVHAVARRSGELEALRREAEAKGGGRVVPAVLDVVDADALAGAIARAERSAGGALDLVIANAGVGLPTPGRAIDRAAVKRVLDVNVSAACVTIAAALPAMVSRGAGTIAAMSSLAAYRGLPGTAAYCASKAALATFMESLRVDLRGTGVRAVTIHPGFVKTEMTSRNPFPMPFLMDLDEAVALMARRIARGDATIAFPWPMHAIIRVVGALPRAVYEPLAGLLGGQSARRRVRPAYTPPGS